MAFLRTTMLALAAASFTLTATAPAAAQYPDKPMRWILPFPAGGAVDIVARTVAAKMSEDLGKPIIIENKAGAGGIIATDAVAKAAPDGYTLLLTTPNHTINAALQATLPYDTEKDLVPVSVVAEVPEVLVSHPAAPFTNFREFVDYAKKNPGKLNYSSAGIGTLPHITFELLLRRTGIEVAHIPYRGAAPAMTDLLAGVVQLKLDTYATSNPHVVAGKLRMLGIASRERSKLMPERADHRRDGSAGLRRHSLDRADGAGRNARGRDRPACGCQRQGGARARHRREVATRRRRSDRRHAAGAGRDDRPRVAAVARARQSRQYQAAIGGAASLIRTPECRS